MDENITQGNVCPQCSNPSLSIAEDADSVRGACQSCGYTFSNEKPKKQKGGGIGASNLFSVMSGIGWIIAIISIVLVIVVAVTIGGSVGSMEGKLDSIDGKVSNFQTNIDGLDTDMSGVQESIDDNTLLINTATTNLNGLITKVNSVEGDLGTITTEIDNVNAGFSAVNATVEELNTTVEELKDIIGDGELMHVKVNITTTNFTSILNETNNMYQWVEITLDGHWFSITTEFQEVLFRLFYNDSINITLIEVTNNYEPQILLNGNNDMLVWWFGEELVDFHMKFNVTWFNGDFNTTFIPIDETNLRINTHYFNDVEIWEKII